MALRIERRDWGSAAAGSASGFVGAPLRAALLVTAALALLPVQALAQVPAAPTNLQADVRSALIYISWAHPNDPSITGYEYRARIGSESGWRPDWTAFDSDADTTSVRFGNVAGGVTVRFEIRARNANGPGSSSDVTVTAQSPPIVRVVVSSTTVGRGGTVSLTATARDEDGGPVTYLWEAPSGSFDATDRASVTWTAPSVAGRVRISLTVTDDEGDTTSGTVEITVGGGGSGSGSGGGTGSSSGTGDGGGGGVTLPVNIPPTVSLSCEPCRVRQGLGVSLEATASDPDGHELSYSWSAEQGRFIGETDGADGAVAGTGRGRSDDDPRDGLRRGRRLGIG